LWSLLYRKHGKAFDYEGRIRHYHRLSEGVRITVKTEIKRRGSGWDESELLNRKVFYNLREAKVVIEKWRQEYNTVRPHSSLDYRPPAPEAIIALHFDPFWLSSSQENIAQILT
jgi:transposase InsO family protein